MWRNHKFQIEKKKNQKFLIFKSKFHHPDSVPDFGKTCPDVRKENEMLTICGILQRTVTNKNNYVIYLQLYE